MRRRIAWLGGSLAACVLGVASPALASVESLKISTPATQTVGKPLTIMAAGVADGSNRLYAYADESRSTCAPNPHAESSERSNTVALSGAEGEGLPAGSFSKPYTYTPTIHGTRLRPGGRCGDAGTAPVVGAASLNPVNIGCMGASPARPA